MQSLNKPTVPLRFTKAFFITVIICVAESGVHTKRLNMNLSISSS